MRVNSRREPLQIRRAMTAGIVSSAVLIAVVGQNLTYTPAEYAAVAGGVGVLLLACYLVLRWINETRSR